MSKLSWDVVKHTQPWRHEPASDAFFHHGLPCRIIRHQLGHYCGYVGVKAGHPLYGVNFDTDPQELRNILINAEASGRTLTARMKELLQDGEFGPTLHTLFEVHGGITYAENHMPSEIPDGYWWFGFDCGHLGKDISPFHPDMERLEGIFTAGEYRPYSYVRQHVEKLAEQLALLA